MAERGFDNPGQSRATSIQAKACYVRGTGHLAPLASRRGEVCPAAGRRSGLHWWFLLGLLAWSLNLGMLAGPAPAAHAQTSEPNLARYDDQQFGPKDRVLDMGIQPLWVPTSTITEAMRRDGVLHREMARLGMTVRFHPFAIGPDGNRSLLAGQLDGMLAGDMPTISAAARGEVVIISLVHQGFAAVVARGVRHLADLRGQSVGYSPGSSAHFALLRALELHGLRPEQVNLVPYKIIDQGIESLRAGKVAAISSWEPHTTIITKLMPEARVLQRSLFEGYLYFTRQAVASHPQAVRQILAAQLRAMAWMRVSEENLHKACQWAIDEQARFSGTPAPITLGEYAALVKTSLLDVAPVPEVPEAQMDQGGLVYGKYQFLLKEGALPAGTSFERIRNSFDRGMVAEVRARAEAFHLAEFDYGEQVR